MKYVVDYNSICPDGKKQCLGRFVASNGDKLGGYIDVRRCPPCMGDDESANPALRADNRYSQKKKKKTHYFKMGRIQR